MGDTCITMLTDHIGCNSMTAQVVLSALGKELPIGHSPRISKDQAERSFTSSFLTRYRCYFQSTEFLFAIAHRLPELGQTCVLWLLVDLVWARAR